MKRFLLFIALMPALLSCVAVKQDSEVDLIEVDLSLGQTVYESSCASCHGLQGEGQPNWKERAEDGKLPAPPHDDTGHTWHHTDELLLQVIAEGSSDPNSDMVGYADQLSQKEMEASLTYIKTFWGEQERQFQAQITQQSAVRQ